ncbi:MAG: tetratricopeptide repeat protein, partial [Elusimicrobiota bacterium]
MHENRRTNLVILAALLMIAVAFAVYATLVMRWFSASARSLDPAPREAARQAQLDETRKEFRARLLDCRAHLRLSEALWKSGRPVDSFYVFYAARHLFTTADFSHAHAEVVLGAGGPAAAIRARLKGLADPALAVPIHAQTAREYPSSPEGRDCLDQLSRMAIGDENRTGGDSSRLALAALEELYAQDTSNPEKLAALAGAAFTRGDVARAHALASEALRKRPHHAGAARIFGMIALKDRDLDAARRWLTAAWDRNPNDLYSASKLAQIYDKRRADPESALPYYLALYRQNPDYDDDGPVERRIRETLDTRRENLLKDAPVSGLGGRFKLDDASLRAEACLRAASYADPRWIDVLGELLDDDAEIVRRSADYALFKIAQKEPDAVRVRRDAWLNSPQPLVRIRA